MNTESNNLTTHSAYLCAWSVSSSTPRFDFAIRVCRRHARRCPDPRCTTTRCGRIRGAPAHYAARNEDESKLPRASNAHMPTDTLDCFGCVGLLVRWWQDRYRRLRRRTSLTHSAVCPQCAVRSALATVPADSLQPPIRRLCVRHTHEQSSEIARIQLLSHCIYLRILLQ